MQPYATPLQKKFSHIKYLTDAPVTHIHVEPIPSFSPKAQHHNHTHLLCTLAETKTTYRTTPALAMEHPTFTTREQSPTQPVEEETRSSEFAPNSLKNTVKDTHQQTEKIQPWKQYLEEIEALNKENPVDKEFFDCCEGFNDHSLAG